MSIGSTNYQVPVQVNGFTCHNCTEVDEAKKHIDPAHPKSGPYGIDAKTDPTQKKSAIQPGGSLNGATTSSTSTTSASGTTASSATSGTASATSTPTTTPQTTAQATAPGQSVNILA